MLWALLITFLITKLAGGPEEIFMTPDLKKQIKTHVEDKERQGIILDEIKVVKKENKAFGRLRKYHLKKIKKASMIRETTLGQLLVLYQSYFDDRISLQNSFVDHRINIQNLLDDEEWRHLIEDAVLPSDKLRKKTDKKENKVDEQAEKFLNKLKKVVEDNISEPERRKQIVAALSDFSEILYDFIDEGKRMNFEDSELVRNKNASREELKNFYKRHNNLRMHGTVEFFKIREVARENTNDKEWKAIMKSLAGIIKS